MLTRPSTTSSPDWQEITSTHPLHIFDGPSKRQTIQILGELFCFLRGCKQPAHTYKGKHQYNLYGHRQAFTRSLKYFQGLPLSPSTGSTFPSSLPCCKHQALSASSVASFGSPKERSSHPQNQNTARPKFSRVLPSLFFPRTENYSARVKEVRLAFCLYRVSDACQDTWLCKHNYFDLRYSGASTS